MAEKNEVKKSLPSDGGTVLSPDEIANWKSLVNELSHGKETFSAQEPGSE
ncbi:hypothetical protein [Enterococcus dispar]|jgi:hypothetical protein|nr:hypothetical protein [Enterococcus dispar]MDT2706770.1 hypothetical protein [Enterococcus dispar]